MEMDILEGRGICYYIIKFMLVLERWFFVVFEYDGMSDLKW